MEKEILKEPILKEQPNYVEELLEIFRSKLPSAQLLEKLDDYHENDIAGALAPFWRRQCSPDRL